MPAVAGGADLEQPRAEAARRTAEVQEGGRARREASAMRRQSLGSDLPGREDQGLGFRPKRRRTRLVHELVARCIEQFIAGWLSGAWASAVETSSFRRLRGHCGAAGGGSASLPADVQTEIAQGGGAPWGLPSHLGISNSPNSSPSRERDLALNRIPRGRVLVLGAQNGRARGASTR